MTITAPADAMRVWREDPSRFVRDLFGITPDPWQDLLLKAFPHHQRIAMKASKGVGKTAIEAWLAWNFLLTRPQPKIAATSISGDNLSDNLWTEMAYWQGKSPLLSRMFEWTKTRIFAKDFPETWWMSARTWSKTADRNQQSQTLAGLHADYIMFVLDESGGMPDAIMASAEAALSSCVEGHIVQAGNPTNLDGPLYAACTTERRLWHVVDINGDPDDPMRSPRVSIEWARDQIFKYGRNDPFVLVNVFGQFPPSSFNALIGPEEVDEAMRRAYRDHDYIHAPKILGVDVALYGDDRSVIFPRQGLVAMRPSIFRGMDGTTGAGIVARKVRDWGTDAEFIDNTGGYGSSWIDNLIRLGGAPIGVAFNGKASDPRFKNKRTEMIFDTVDWIRKGGQLPPPDAPGSNELKKALISTTYAVPNGITQVEPKDMIKARIGFSPDEMDALILTFAHPVTSRNRDITSHQRMKADYNPYAVFDRAPDYQPYSGMM